VNPAVALVAVAEVIFGLTTAHDRITRFEG
jgi:hypothetical protein